MCGQNVHFVWSWMSSMFRGKESESSNQGYPAKDWNLLDEAHQPLWVISNMAYCAAKCNFSLIGYVRVTAYKDTCQCSLLLITTVHHSCRILQFTLLFVGRVLSQLGSVWNLTQFLHGCSSNSLDCSFPWSSQSDVVRLACNNDIFSVYIRHDRALLVCSCFTGKYSYF